MRSRIAFLLTAFSVFLSGCVPIPARTIDAPRVEGSVQASGELQEGLNIYVLNKLGDACAKADEKEAPSAVTDSKGRFVIPAEHGWSPVRWAVPADGIAVLSLCIENENFERKWAYYSYIRTQEWAPDLHLVCYLDKQLDGPIMEKIEPIEVRSTCLRRRS